MVKMDRRKVIAMLGCAAAVWPITAAAQSARKLPRIGYLSDEGVAPHLFHSQTWILDGLSKLGYADARADKTKKVPAGEAGAYRVLARRKASANADDCRRLARSLLDHE